MSNKVIFKSFISIFIFLSVILSFNSCKNFLSGSKLKEELDESIEYANAKKISVLLLPEEGTGSTIPSGNYEAKNGYPFKITFSENSEQYSFVRWIAVKNNVEVTEGVNFENPDAYETNVTIKEADGIKIYPLCKKRIELATEPSPRYEPNGVSRDRSILVEFTKVPKNDCFIFYENELPEGAEPVVNAEGQIWAYKKDGYTYLKNVSITNSDDISIAEHFNQPEIEENRLFITVNKENPIEFETGVIYKTVKVTLSNNICDEDGITMYSDKGWRYQITEDTDEKATVNLTSDVMEGTVYLAGQKDYSIGQKITLSFTENADYQFLYWSYDNAIISVSEPKNPSTTAIIKEKTTGSGTEIKAVCAPRLRVESFSPQITEAIPSVAKDRAIEIVFNKNLPTDEESLKQLDNIIISIGGTPVNTNFNAPKIVDNKITIEANKSNVLDVSEGQTKTVTVTIPENFYYLFDDVTKVTYGGNGKSFIYVIDETTFDKAGVSYSIPAGAGTFNINTANQPFEYSMGQIIPLEFTPNEEWDFYGWKITDSEGKDVDTKYLEIKKEKDGEYYLYVKESIQGVNIKADCKFKSLITSAKAGNNPDLYHRLGYECDSIVSFKFNTEIKEENLTLTVPDSKKKVSIQNNIDIVSTQSPSEHYEDYFTLRYDSTTKTLKLYPILSIKNLVPNNTDVFDFTIIFNGENIYNDQNNTLKGELSFLYRINGTQESIKPTELEVVMYKTRTVDNGETKYSEIVEKKSSFSNKYDISEIFYLNKYYLYVKARDTGGKIKAVKINETLTHDYTDYNIDQALQKTYTNEYGIDCFVPLENDYYQIDIPVEFVSNSDGQIQLEITVVDYAGNEADNSVTYTVIRDTSVSSINLKIMSSFNNSSNNKVEAFIKDKTIINHPNDNGMYVYNLNVSCSEPKYGQLSSTAEGQTLKLQEFSWGYDENCSENLQSGNTNIEVNPSKNVYFKMKFYDNAKNIAEYLRIIPALPKIIKYEEYTISGTNKGLQVYCSDDNIQKSLVNEKKVDSFGYWLFYVEYDENTNTVTGDYKLLNKLNDIPVGNYRIYAVPYFTFGFDYYYGLCSSNYLTINKSGETSWSITLETSNENTDIQVPAQTDNCVCTVATAELNTSYRTVTFNYGSFKKAPNINYYIKATPIGQNCFGLSPVETLNTTDVFNLDSGSKYAIKIKAVDENGDYKESEVLYNVDLTDFDNCPPYYNQDSISKANITSNCIKLLECDETKIPKDLGTKASGLYKNSKNKYEIEYYFIPRGNIRFYEPLKYSYEDLTTIYSQYKHVTTFDNEYKTSSDLDNTLGYYSIDFPFDNLEKGIYDFCFILKDKNGNYTIHSMGFYRDVISSIEKLSPFRKSTDNTKITCSIGTGSSQAGVSHAYKGVLVESFQKQNNGINRWEPVKPNSYSNPFVYKETTSSVSVNYEIKITTEYPNNFSFVRVNYYDYHEQVTMGGPLIRSWTPVYYYIPYEITPTDYPCRNKNLMDCGGNRMQIFCDAPCLIHTMYCSANLGNDEKSWYSRGIEVNTVNAIRQESSDFTYNVPVSDIPDDAYYVTVVHFADGTSIMSDVKQR